MNNRKEDYKNFLIEKFGKKLLNVMIRNENQLCLKEEIKYDTGINNSEYTVKVLDDYPEKIKDKLTDYALKEWVFDFPGWIGELNFDETNAPVRDIMVVGMEPHIEGRYYQTTYGLRKTVNGFGEIKNSNNKNIWKNLYSVFSEEKLSSGEECYEEKFLSRIYITDLSHFAIKGKVNQMKIYSNWRDIRTVVAEEFLIREIKLIKPKYIVSQGNDVAKVIKVILEKEFGSPNMFIDFKNKLKGWKSTPILQKFEKNDLKVIHVKLPHLASGQTQWRWKIMNENENFRNELNKKINNF